MRCADSAATAVSRCWRSVALALGIGATTVIFSVIENVLIEPFPYRAPERLALVYVHDTTRPEDYNNPSFLLPEFLDIRDQNHVFEDVMGNSGSTSSTPPRTARCSSMGSG